MSDWDKPFKITNCLDGLMELPDRSVHCCITSPPYWGLRNYAMTRVFDTRADADAWSESYRKKSTDRVFYVPHDTTPVFESAEDVDGPLTEYVDVPGKEPIGWKGNIEILTIWDETPGCEHDWVDNSYVRKSSDNKGNKGDEKQRTNEGTIGRDVPVRNSFCSKCGAWMGQLGLEPTPELYVGHLVQIFSEVRRVLRDDGTLWLNLGDSYNGSGGAGGDYATGGIRDGQPRYPGRNVGGLKPKDLVGIPWMVAFALRAEGWYLRSDIIWCKVNCMPESMTDRPTKAHEYVFLLAKSQKYYYDADAVREENAPATVERARYGWCKSDTKASQYQAINGLNRPGEYPVNPMGRNKRSYWVLTTRPYKGAHFATFPVDLIEPMIKAGTSEKGCCPKCGSFWERMTERTNESNWEFRKSKGAIGGSMEGGNKQQIGSDWSHDLPIKETKTLGWIPTCSCGVKDPVPCIVLDPFLGSGTTLEAARNLGRKGIGFEINPEYGELIRKRGMTDVKSLEDFA